MERTARLVRIARARLASTPDPWLRGAADAAAAVGKSVGGSWHEATQAAGGGSGREVRSGRDGACSFAEKDAVVGRAKATKIGGLAGSLATGPGSGLSLLTFPLTKADGSRAGAVLGTGERLWTEAGGGHRATSARKRAHDAAAAGGSERQVADALVQAGDASGLEVASGPDGACTSVEKDAAVGKANGTELGDLARSRATGPGSGLSLTASPLTKGDESSRAARQASPLGPGDRVRKEAGGGHGALSGHKRAHDAGRSGRQVADALLQEGGGSVRDLADAILHAGGASGREVADATGKKKSGHVRADELSESSVGEGHQKGRDVRADELSESSAKVCSLSFHDKELVSCDMIDEDGSTALDFSEQITSALMKSSGPFSSFRIDCSTWSNDSCLEGWLDLLSQKSVHELDLLNLSHKAWTVFPIESLQSPSLERLKLGFFTVNLDLNCFYYSSLRVLDFFCCTLESRKLSWVVSDCKVLQDLKVAYCKVDIHISSNSLKSLHSVGNVGNKILIISAPALVSLLCDMVPDQKSGLVRQKVAATISLNDVPKLKIIEHFILPYHEITIHSKDITKVVEFLPTVIKLMLLLEMSNVSQSLKLLKLLESFPNLQSLSLKRMDKIEKDEALFHPFDDFDEEISTGCVNSLTCFTIQDFTGGPSEKLIIKSILRCAPDLVELCTFNSASCSKRIVRQAVKEIKTYDKLSKGCKLSFQR